jgi:hypothetical protein
MLILLLYYCVDVIKLSKLERGSKHATQSTACSVVFVVFSCDYHQCVNAAVAYLAVCAATLPLCWYTPVLMLTPYTAFLNIYIW